MQRGQESATSLSMLRVAPVDGSAAIVDGSGRPVRMRGVGVGGWMQLEAFINGFPGLERDLRAVAADILGARTARHLFERMLDHLFGSEDAAWLASLGVDTVRLSVSHRHLEDESRPFVYLDDGFARLDAAIAACARHGIRSVIDLHGAPGGQNPDWHCDNDTLRPLLFRHPHFQDRCVALWEEIARRHVGDGAVAAYDVLNEPSTGHPYGPPDSDALNGLHRRLVAAIRAIDPDHVIVLEGDTFASDFRGLDAPFAENLVYSSHNYTDAGFGPGAYPGRGRRGERWDATYQRRIHERMSGTRFCADHGAPLWCGEFGSAYNGPSDEVEDRVRAVDDQISLFETEGVHWSLWTYKDCGVMGLLRLDPDSDYMEMVRPVLDAKTALGADPWMSGWLAPTPAQRSLSRVARHIDDAASACDPGGDGFDFEGRTDEILAKSALALHAGSRLQPAWVRPFRGMSESRIDEVMSAFSLHRCLPNTGLVDVVRRHTGAATDSAVA